MAAMAADAAGSPAPAAAERARSHSPAPRSPERGPDSVSRLLERRREWKEGAAAAAAESAGQLEAWQEAMSKTHSPSATGRGEMLDLVETVVSAAVSAAVRSATPHKARPQPRPSVRPTAAPLQAIMDGKEHALDSLDASGDDPAFALPLAKGVDGGFGVDGPFLAELGTDARAQGEVSLGQGGRLSRASYYDLDPKEKDRLHGLKVESGDELLDWYDDVGIAGKQYASSAAGFMDGMGAVGHELAEVPPFPSLGVLGNFEVDVGSRELVASQMDYEGVTDNFKVVDVESRVLVASQVDIEGVAGNFKVDVESRAPVSSVDLDGEREQGGLPEWVRQLNEGIFEKQEQVVAARRLGVDVVTAVLPAKGQVVKAECGENSGEVEVGRKSRKEQVLEVIMGLILHFKDEDLHYAGELIELYDGLMLDVEGSQRDQGFAPLRAPARSAMESRSARRRRQRRAAARCAAAAGLAGLLPPRPGVAPGCLAAAAAVAAAGRGETAAAAGAVARAAALGPAAAAAAARARRLPPAAAAAGAAAPAAGLPAAAAFGAGAAARAGPAGGGGLPAEALAAAAAAAEAEVELQWTVGLD
ncbi:unnamed protein product [Prorocentrum cordatum]|uniref:Uncharacterized protein n=1 Tax=Prorocentrum cordatum TaxID=2364126 RepID=A0ABN9WUQ0_9DINO|nr:unnamed protein product [Polarella glacialis]